jgi:hypothetical protein
LSVGNLRHQGCSTKEFLEGPAPASARVNLQPTPEHVVLARRSPSGGTEPECDGSGEARLSWTSRFREHLSWLFRAEAMPVDPRPSPPHSSGRAFFSWLFRPEVMPDRQATPTRERGSGFFSWLFRPEPMPQGDSGSESTAPKTGPLSWLFRPEPFPNSPDDETGPRR